VVFDLVNPGYGRIEYWLQQLRNMRHNSVRAPVILVGTRKDHASCTAEHVAGVMAHLEQRFPRYRYTNICGLLCVSNKTGEGIGDLRQLINERAERASLVVPATWVQLYDLISSHRERRGCEYVSMRTFQQWCTQCHVPASEIADAIEFLSSVGSLIHFNDPASALNELIVLNPQWLANIMSAVISFRHSWVRSGQFARKDLVHILKAYDPTLHDTILALLLKFNIVIHLKHAITAAAASSSSSSSSPSTLPLDTSNAIEPNAAGTSDAMERSKTILGRRLASSVSPPPSSSPSSTGTDSDANSPDAQASFFLVPSLLPESYDTLALERLWPPPSAFDFDSPASPASLTSSGSSPMSSPATSFETQLAAMRAATPCVCGQQPCVCASSGALPPQPAAAAAAAAAALTRSSPAVIGMPRENTMSSLGLSPSPLALPSTHSLDSVSHSMPNTMAPIASPRGGIESASPPPPPPSPSVSSSKPQTLSSSVSCSALVRPPTVQSDGSHAGNVTPPTPPTPSLGSRLVQRGRVFEFPFMPIGLVGRIIARALYLPNVVPHVYWKNGVLLAQRRQIALIEWVPIQSRLYLYARDRDREPLEMRSNAGTSMSTSTNTSTGDSTNAPNVLTPTTSGGASHILLRQLTELITSLLAFYYPTLASGVSQWIPCCHCFRSRSTYRQPFLFSVDECTQALAAARTFLYCNHINLPSRRVRLDELAPDISFADLPELDASSLEILSTIFESPRIIVYRASWRGSLVAVKEPQLRSLVDTKQFNDLQREAFIMRYSISQTLVVCMISSNALLGTQWLTTQESRANARRHHQPDALRARVCTRG